MSSLCCCFNDRRVEEHHDYFFHSQFFSFNVVPWFPLPFFQTEAPKESKAYVCRGLLCGTCTEVEISRPVRSATWPGAFCALGYTALTYGQQGAADVEMRSRLQQHSQVELVGCRLAVHRAPAQRWTGRCTGVRIRCPRRWSEVMGPRSERAVQCGSPHAATALPPTDTSTCAGASGRADVAADYV